jgi:hypothetical protein
LLLDTGWRHSSDRVDTTDMGPVSRADTNQFTSRALLDTLIRPSVGFLRGGLWHDSGRADGAQESFQRLVARAGYAQEIRLNPGQTLGLEVIAGAGKLWGDAPASSRFWGATRPRSFFTTAPRRARCSICHRGL